MVGCGKRQCFVVLEQDGALRCRLGREQQVRIVIAGKVELASLLAFGRQARQALQRSVDDALVEHAFFHGLRKGTRMAFLGSGHHEVEPGLERADAFAERAPVRDHHTVPAPLVSELIGEQRLALGRMDAVDLVVGRHDHPRVCPVDDERERAQVYLVERPLVDDGIRGEARELLRVAGKVLEAGAHALLLHAFDKRRGQGPGKVGVFAVVLEVPAAQGASLHVDAGAEQDVHARAPAFLRYRLSDCPDELGVEARGKGARRGKAGRGKRRVEARVVGTCLRDFLAQSMRSIGHHDARDAQRGIGMRAPRGSACQQAGLFSQGVLFALRVRSGHVPSLLRENRRN